MVVNEAGPQQGPETFWSRTKNLFVEAARRLTFRRETGPIDTVDELSRFVRTRAAFVAQKKLYGYLKARMGTRFPTVFEDEVFAESINIAKWHVFAACLSDITVHAVARAVAGGGLSAKEGQDLALACFEAGLSADGAVPPDATWPAGWRTAFTERLDKVHWEGLAAGGDALTESPAALYHWAPIDDQLKRYDRDIVENSIRFAWAEVTRDFRKRAVPQAIVADFRQRGPAGK